MGKKLDLYDDDINSLISNNDFDEEIVNRFNRVMFGSKIDTKYNIEKKLESIDSNKTFNIHDYISMITNKNILNNASIMTNHFDNIIKFINLYIGYNINELFNMILSMKLPNFKIKYGKSKRNNNILYITIISETEPTDILVSSHIDTVYNNTDINTKKFYPKYQADIVKDNYIKSMHDNLTNTLTLIYLLQHNIITKGTFVFTNFEERGSAGAKSFINKNYNLIINNYNTIINLDVTSMNRNEEFISSFEFLSNKSDYDLADSYISDIIYKYQNSYKDDNIIHKLITTYLSPHRKVSFEKSIYDDTIVYKNLISGKTIVSYDLGIDIGDMHGISYINKHRYIYYFATLLDIIK